VLVDFFPVRTAFPVIGGSASTMNFRGLLKLHSLDPAEDQCPALSRDKGLLIVFASGQACKLAARLKRTFVPRLRPGQLPNQAAW